MSQTIILRNLQKPSNINRKEDIEWLGDSFGLCSGRDTQKISFLILETVLKEVANDGSTSTEHIANDLDISIQRVNYHLKSLIDAGFLLRNNKLIFIRQGSVKAAVEEMRQDANRIFDSLSKIGEEIDTSLGLKNR